MSTRESRPSGALSVAKSLEEAYKDHLRRVSTLFKDYADLPENEQPPLRAFIKQNPVVADAIALERWAHPEEDSLERRAQRAKRLTKLCDEARMPYELTAFMLSGILKRRKGAPIKAEVRRLAVRALEAKHTDPNFSWMRFARKNCACSKSAHDLACKERIRQAAIELQRLMRKVGISD